MRFFLFSLSLLLLCISPTTFLQAQDVFSDNSDICNANEIYAGILGFYPYPAGDEMPNPITGETVISQGIPPACLGKDYAFDLTVAIPDSMTVGGVFDPPVLKKLDSMVLKEIKGLPEGFELVSNTSTVASNNLLYGDQYVFFSDETYCVRIQGTSDMPFDNSLEFLMQGWIADIGILLGLEFKFDGYNFKVVDTPDCQEIVDQGENDDTCTPDEAYNSLSDIFGIFPYPACDEMPDPITGEMVISQGIPPACLGEDYAFDFTVVIPDSMDAGGGLSTLMKIDSMVLKEIKGLPEGFEVVSNASVVASDDLLYCGKHVFFGDEIYCVRIQGTSNMPFDNPLEFIMQAWSVDLDLPGGEEVKFGDYNFKVLDVPDCQAIIDCEEEVDPTSINDLNTNISKLSNYPNPFAKKTTVVFTGKVAESITFDVYNINGESIYKMLLDSRIGLNEIEFKTDKLTPGIYIYSISNSQQKVTNRMTISK